MQVHDNAYNRTWSAPGGLPFLGPGELRGSAGAGLAVLSGSGAGVPEEDLMSFLLDFRAGRHGGPPTPGAAPAPHPVPTGRFEATPREEVDPYAGSDAPLGPGWWQASDARWYPPELHPDAAAPDRPAAAQAVEEPPASEPEQPPQGRRAGRFGLGKKGPAV